MPRTALALSLSLTASLFALSAAAQEELNALVWCDHTDPALIEPFEKAFNVKVNLKEYEGTAAGLAIQAGGDQALFQPAGTDYQVTNVSGQNPSAFTLSGSDRFTLAAWSPGQSAWLAPDAIFCSALSASCALSWSGLLVGFAVDLVQSPPPVPAPVLASLYLLGSGVFGLAAVGRRRSASPLPNPY